MTDTQETSKDQLKPCPFCHAAHDGGVVRIASVWEDHEDCCEVQAGHQDCWQVVCDAKIGGCGAAGGYAITEDKAVEKWNRRPAPEPAPASGERCTHEIWRELGEPEGYSCPWCEIERLQKRAEDMETLLLSIRKGGLIPRHYRSTVASLERLIGPDDGERHFGDPVEPLRAVHEPLSEWEAEARELFRQTTFDDGAISMAEWERRRDALMARPSQQPNASQCECPVPGTSAVERFPELSQFELEMQTPSGWTTVRENEDERAAAILRNSSAVHSMLGGGYHSVDVNGQHTQFRLTPKAWLGKGEE